MTLYTVCMSCLSFASMFISGAHRSMIPIVGVLYGEKDYRGIRMLVRNVLIFTLGLVSFFVILAFIFPQAVLSLFNLPENLIASGGNAIRLFSLSLIGVTATFLMVYYYTTVQQRTAANIVSFTEGFLAVVPLAWLLSRVIGINGIWIAFIIAEIIGFSALYLYVRYVSRNSGGKFSDIYLIEKSGNELLYDVSVKATNEDAVKLSQEAIDVLNSSGIDEKISSRAGLALEEMTANCAKYNSGKNAVNIDVRIINAGRNIVLALRDDGKPFNPVEYSPQESEEYKFDEIMMLKSIAKDIQYNRVLSLNQTLIEIGA